MDMNIVLLSGRLAAVPETRVLEDGRRLIRYLVTVQSEAPRRRVDVLPVTLWDPPAGLVDEAAPPGRRIYAAGSVRRRFWAEDEGRRSRIEVVADQVCLKDEPDIAPFAAPDDCEGDG